METTLEHDGYHAQQNLSATTQNQNRTEGFSLAGGLEEIYDDENLCQESEHDSESGVEPDYAEWVFDTQNDDGVLIDLSNEQALATLRYFTSTADRTNMMTKFHNNDLDLLSQLLSDKEKDLSLAAQIGQSLLQRNKSLMEKIERMEDYLSSSKENEEQLKYDLHHKSELVRMYYEDDEQRSLGSVGSRDDSCEDEEMIKLTKRCRQLEKENHSLFTEALNICEVTDDMENKEEDLVFDCIQQLSEAKEQITNLTDEIAQKFEDNVQQQEEITQLINMVVELQKKQKQLSTENEILQNQLDYAKQNENSLQEQLLELQSKFRETYEMLQENQEEMKQLKENMEYSDSPTSWLNDTSNSLMFQDSLANEIEESVRRDLSFTQERRTQHNKVLDNVRRLNLRTSEPLSRSTSGRTSPVSNWSIASDERSESISALSIDSEGMRTKKTVKKLQIVKPMEGSETLNKWHHLASQNVRGGLQFSEGSSPLPQTKEGNISFDDDRSTVVEDEEKVLPSVEESPVVDEQPVQNKPRKSPKQSTPQGEKNMLRLLNTPMEKKRTIITRNSAALNSLRQGRKMLSGNGAEGKTKSEVIDMIANAMNKVNVEAKTGQRILTSLKSGSSGRERALSVTKSPEYKDYTDMPNVSRVLEKAANAKAGESEATLSPERVLSSPEPGDDAVQKLPKVALNSISGPLGLLKRANPIDTNDNIMSRLYRLSGNASVTSSKPKMLQSSTSFDVVNELDFDSGISTAGSLDSASIRRNQSSGAIVDMARHQSNLRPFGMTSLLSSSSDNVENSRGVVSVSAEELNSAASAKFQKTSKSVETGLDSVPKKTDESSSSTSSVYNGFFSFLGKLT